MITVAVLGMGVRGAAYADVILKNGSRARLTAACDPNINKAKLAKEKYDVPENRVFLSDKDFFAAGKLADALFICTQDSQHFSHTMTALELGYDILLEKPIAVSEAECEKIILKAEKLGRKISVCHELRYSFLAQEIKQLLDSGALGEVVNISQVERVGFYHQAHSFVRGNWSKSEESTPMILSKCCHDLDLISYFASSPCESVSSIGSLKFFRRENQPKNAADYCCKCPVRGDCPYDALKFYSGSKKWTERTGGFFEEFNEGNILEWLSDEKNPYSRCVFACDNDVVDNQTVNMQFKNGICANLTMTAFTNDESRKITVYCTRGELEADMGKNIIKVAPFGKEAYTLYISELYGEVGEHCGGDKGMVEDFISQLEESPNSKCLTDIAEAVISHKIAFAAEKSRCRGGKVIDIK